MSRNVVWQNVGVGGTARAAIKRQRPRCLWLTGLPGAGKSTLAHLLEHALHERGLHTYLLDGDNVRHGLSCDLGFSEADRDENIRRIAEVARLMVDAGLVIIVAFISPYRREREFARGLFSTGDFVEVFVDTPREECERRDPKGMYAKARHGEITNFTGVDGSYQAPENPEIRIDTTGMEPQESLANILDALERLAQS
jgi:bifunctional enzyme CysN/CysC